MVYAKHAHVGFPIILLLIISNLYNTFVRLTGRLEVLIQVAFLGLDTGHALLSLLVYLLSHHLSRLSLLQIPDIFILDMRLLFRSLSGLNECQILISNLNLLRNISLYFQSTISFKLRGSNLLIIQIVPVFVRKHALDSMFLES